MRISFRSIFPVVPKAVPISTFHHVGGDLQRACYSDKAHKLYNYQLARIFAMGAAGCPWSLLF